LRLRCANSQQLWECDLLFTVLPGNAVILPDLILNVPSSQADIFTIMSRAKNSPAALLAFNLYFATPSIGVFHKPFVSLGTYTTNWVLTTPFTPKELKELQKQ
jgi:hypothetical protein